MPPPPIYMDHHATTPCHPRVVEAMLPLFTENFGNPASLTHEHGRRASNALEEARYFVATRFRVQPNEIAFTAGATESNNLALNLLKPGDHLITSAMEHKSILGPAKRAEKAGVDVTILSPDREGFIDPAALRDAFRADTRLVSIEAANAEIGTIQAVSDLGAACRERGILFHSDVTQALGKVPLDFANIDLASFSAHKFYGPKGAGGLLVRRGARIEPLLLGGGQERGLRSGTLNVPGAVGLATALRVRMDVMAEEGERLTALRNELWNRIENEIDGAYVNGPRERRLPGNLNVSFERLESDALMIALRRFSLSSGSACSSGERSPSPVLMAIGVSEPLAIGSIRIGLGASNTAEETAMLALDLKRAVARLREISAA